MTVKELMERVGTTETSRVIAYIKDGLEEINMLAPTNITTTRVDIEKDKRYYDIPVDCVQITDIRCKNHLNSKDEYRSLPRMIGEPVVEDADQELI
tara:strand:+ start:114 stop:401 length:288 start_codon:yes stop_codon:yes gene_type:complete